MALREIIQIDEELCDGCGKCATACAEGAIQMVHGKARLVSDSYCDGLGACVGECPRGALRVVQRDAVAFDEAAVEHHLQQTQRAHAAAGLPLAPRSHALAGGGCPGTRVQSFAMESLAGRSCAEGPGKDQAEEPSALGHWPVQLRLVSPGAPFLHDADLLLVADCVPFALADFHRRFLRGKPVVIGCPKLDDSAAYVEKLAEILRKATPRSLTVVHMEVPCCTGLTRIAEAARRTSGSNVPLHDVTVSVRGKVLRDTTTDSTTRQETPRVAQQLEDLVPILEDLPHRLSPVKQARG